MKSSSAAILVHTAVDDIEPLGSSLHVELDTSEGGVEICNFLEEGVVDVPSAVFGQVEVVLGKKRVVRKLWWDLSWVSSLGRRAESWGPRVDHR